jgi:hypothetical protein
VLAEKVESGGFIHTFSTPRKAEYPKSGKKILFAQRTALSNIFPGARSMLAYVLSFERQYLLRYFRLCGQVFKICQGSLPFRQKNAIFEY